MLSTFTIIRFYNMGIHNYKVLLLRIVIHVSYKYFFDSYYL